jgi:predicted metal-dependent phosphoesterase TrpH
MIIDMHIHTRYSPCSVIGINHLLRHAARSGLDGICITDHDTSAAASFLRRDVENPGICVIVGVEYTTHQGDFLVFGPVENIPGKMDAAGLFRWARKEKGIVIPAHPFRKERPADPAILESCIIIEGLNGRNRPHENALCSEWVKSHGNGIRLTGGSDAHTVEEIGKCATVFQRDICSTDDLIRELDSGNFVPVRR